MYYDTQVYLFNNFAYGLGIFGASWLLGASETLLFYAQEPLEPLRSHCALEMAALKALRSHYVLKMVARKPLRSHCTRNGCSETISNGILCVLALAASKPLRSHCASKRIAPKPLRQLFGLDVTAKTAKPLRA